MARPSNPLRNEAEEFIRLEVARVGPDGLDKAAIVRRFVERGASQSRVFEWIKGVVRDARHPSAEPDTLAADMAVAEAALVAAERAKVLNSLPTPAELRQLEREADAFIADPPAPPPAKPAEPAKPPQNYAAPAAAHAPAHVAAPPPASPDGSGDIMGQLRLAMDMANKVLTFSCKPDGSIKNPRMVLSAVDALRRCLETGLKLHEAMNNVALVERFMDEMMDALRGLEPDCAKAVLERMRAVQQRWAA